MLLVDRPLRPKLAARERAFRDATAALLRDRYEDGDQNKTVMPIHYRPSLFSCVLASIRLMVVRNADRLRAVDRHTFDVLV